MKKPTVDIYLDEETNDTNIEFYIDPETVFSISIDPNGNIDWSYLWGEHQDHGHGVQFVRGDGHAISSVVKDMFEIIDDPSTSQDEKDMAMTTIREALK